MADMYFSKLGTLVYNGQDVTNILGRARLREDILKRGVLFFDYAIQYGERPDNVAMKEYGRSDLDWLVLFANTVIDPYYEWPMTNDQLNGYVANKYGSISQAAQSVASYEWIMYPAFIEVDGTVHKEVTVQVDATMYATLQAVDRRQTSYYDLEVARNDARRKIKLIDAAFVPAIEAELQNAFL
jgi:hypothetical protein